VEKRITPRTRAIMAVHLYGAPCDMDQLVAIADKHDLLLVEDCAEALGTTLHGRHAGTFGHAASWSFFGNKTVTTGEGGMVGTSDPMLHRRMVMTKGQGQDPERRYWHPILGFNYRMTNLCAAIGTAQLERIQPILERKRQIAAVYRERLSEVPVVFQTLADGAVSSNWLVSILLPPGTDRDRLMAGMAEAGVDSRPVFYCAHRMPHHARDGLSLPLSEDIAARGISLPSFPALTDAEVDRVCEALSHALESASDVPQRL
jgi:perosamine synthetase